MCIHQIVTTTELVRCHLCGKEWTLEEMESMDGPGSRLGRLIKSVAGQRPCAQCRRRLWQMNIWGDGVCRMQIGTIRQWMRTELIAAIGRGDFDENINAAVESIL